MLNKDSMNADKLIDFMTRLPTDSKKKAFLVPDNLRVHHAKKITAWLEEHKEQQRIRVKQPAPAENKEFAALVEQYVNITVKPLLPKGRLTPWSKKTQRLCFRQKLPQWQRSLQNPKI